MYGSFAFRESSVSSWPAHLELLAVFHAHARRLVDDPAGLVKERLGALAVARAVRVVVVVGREVREEVSRAVAAGQRLRQRGAVNRDRLQRQTWGARSLISTCVLDYKWSRDLKI